MHLLPCESGSNDIVNVSSRLQYTMAVPALTVVIGELDLVFTYGNAGCSYSYSFGAVLRYHDCFNTWMGTIRK